MHINRFSLRPIAGSALALTSLLTVSNALGAVTIFTSDPTLYTTAALAGFSTTGADMDGMSVSVTYSDFSVASATWGTTALTAGAAVSAGNFSLTLTGDSYDQNWTLSNLTDPQAETPLSIVSFAINARPGRAIFDIIASPETTTGSDVGRPFTFVSGGTDATVTYSDALKLNANGSPLGDLFLQMLVALDSNSYVAAGGNMVFLQDTDNAEASAIIEEVPEASTYAAGLALAGLTGYGFLRRRQVAKK
jgi:MYXO-CTERM domain-containing protein